MTLTILYLKYLASSVLQSYPPFSWLWLCHFLPALQDRRILMNPLSPLRCALWSHPSCTLDEWESGITFSTLKGNPLPGQGGSHLSPSFLIAWMSGGPEFQYATERVFVQQRKCIPQDQKFTLKEIPHLSCHPVLFITEFFVYNIPSLLSLGNVSLLWQKQTC